MYMKNTSVFFDTDATNDELANAVTDRYDVKYSNDGKKLLEGSENSNYYVVRDGTEIICDDSFTCKYDLRVLFFPSSLKAIGENAFYMCRSLYKVNIQPGLQMISDTAFAACFSLEEINLPDSITYIGESAFGTCRFEHIKLPPKLTKISDGMLFRCHNLKDVQIPPKVTSIGYGAFTLCTSLQRVYIPDSVTNIEENAFDYCDNLEELIVSRFAYDRIKSLLQPNLRSKLIIEE